MAPISFRFQLPSVRFVGADLLQVSNYKLMVTHLLQMLTFYIAWKPKGISSSLPAERQLTDLESLATMTGSYSNAPARRKPL